MKIQNSWGRVFRPDEPPTGAAAEAPEAPEAPETPEVPETPAWDYTPQSPDAPVNLTPAMVQQMIQQGIEAATQSQAEPDWEEKLVQRAKAETTQAVGAEMAKLMAPLAQAQLVSHISKGLGSEAEEFLKARLGKFDANAIGAIAASKDDMDLLRLAAERHVQLKKGTPTVAPVTEGRTKGADNLDSEIEREIDKAYSQMRDVPGLTREGLAKTMRAGMKEAV